jgi:hypothetical protein
MVILPQGEVSRRNGQTGTATLILVKSLPVLWPILLSEEVIGI